jgi:hypothetical protein|uniref:Uncharacterized protein n=1 Tax=viral metagenome TaxID=1070528 RepID=A0A6C0BZ69_9ZZZZ
MPDFNPFSDEGKEWLETHMVEYQYDSIENIGGGLTRTHSSKINNLKVVKEKKEIENTNQEPKTERKLNYNMN